MYTNYYRAEGTDRKSNYIKVALNYDLGGYSVWTGKMKKRGYSMVVMPVEKSGIMEGFMVGEGMRMFLSEVSRQSAKAEEKATNMCKLFEKRMVDDVCNMYGMRLIGGEE